MKALRYRNLDEARKRLKEVAGYDPALDIFSDGGAEPQGLLSVIPEDRLPEEYFYRLCDGPQGTLVEVERIHFPGYGPPAEEDDYMGFTHEHVAYVLKGCRLPVEIQNCPYGAQDLHHLEALVLECKHPLNRQDLRKRLGLARHWSFEDLFELILEDKYTAQEIDRLIHQGIQ